MKKSLLILLTVIGFSCSSSDDDSPCDNLSSNGEDITLNLISAALEFAVNANNNTCLDYVMAAEDYIDYSNSILDCLSAEDRAELEQEIQELETEINGLDCSQ